MGSLNFNAADVPPSEAFDPLPPGWYSMIVTKAELVHSDKAGEMLKLEHEVDENEHPQNKGRKVWSNLCINHPNEQPRKIANRTLSALCHAIGRLQVSEPEELIGSTALVKIKVRPAKDGYDASNDVAGYKAVGGSDTPAAQTADSMKTTVRAAVPGWKK